MLRLYHVRRYARNTLLPEGLVSAEATQSPDRLVRTSLVACENARLSLVNLLQRLASLTGTQDTAVQAPGTQGQFAFFLRERMDALTDSPRQIRESLTALSSDKGSISSTVTSAHLPEKSTARDDDLGLYVSRVRSVLLERC